MQLKDAILSKKVFPVKVLSAYEAELVAKALEGFLLGRAEKTELQTILRRLKSQG